MVPKFPGLWYHISLIKRSPSIKHRPHLNTAAESTGKIEMLLSNKRHILMNSNKSSSTLEGKIMTSLEAYMKKTFL